MTKLSNLTLEEKIQRIKDFRPIDDVFFELLAENPAVCEEIIRTILEDEDLVVLDTITQSSKRNLYGRSVRLDALCILGNGTRCNIEVQRSDEDDHLRRVRFNASSITVRDSDAGECFRDVKEVYIIYISQFDLFGLGKVVYHVEPCILETGMAIDNGEHQIYVNTAVKDESKISALMDCFLKKEVNHPSFPALSEEVKRIKTTQGGLWSMCELMEKYMDEAKQEGRIEERQEMFMSMLAGGRTAEEIAAFCNVPLEEVQDVVRSAAH